MNPRLKHDCREGSKELKHDLGFQISVNPKNFSKKTPKVKDMFLKSLTF